jgi:hypothetical protein
MGNREWTYSDAECFRQLRRRFSSQLTTRKQKVTGISESVSERIQKRSNNCFFGRQAIAGQMDGMNSRRGEVSQRVKDEWDIEG